MTEIPTEALQAAARDKIYAAAGLAMVRVDDDDEEDSYFEWHECIDQPACNTVQTGGPCACSGMPWPSVVVQAGIDAALAAAAPFLIAEGRRQAAADIRAVSPCRCSACCTATARYERELRAKIAAELRQSATIMEPVAADYYRKIADFVDGAPWLGSGEPSPNPLCR